MPTAGLVQLALTSAGETVLRRLPYIAWLAVLASPWRSLASDQSLEPIRQAHAAAIAQIRTFSCEMAVTSNLGGTAKVVRRAQYWRDGDTVRSKSEAAPLGKTDSVVKDHQLTKVTGTEGRISTDAVPLDGDVWSMALLSFYGRERFRVSFDELVMESHTLHSVKTVKENGKELACVSIGHDRASFEILFDPEVNYLVKKMKMHYPGPGPAFDGEEVVTQFAEPHAGIFFPARVERNGTYSDGNRWDEVVTFSDIRINESLAPDVFDFRFPPNILVWDFIHQKANRTDQDGQPVLPGVDDSGREAVIGAAAPPIVPILPGNGNMRATTDEPPAGTRWLLPLSLFFLFCAACIWIARKWRETRIANSAP
jgi:hypothetical protein